LRAHSIFSDSIRPQVRIKVRYFDLVRGLDLAPCF
jgi:hypothetical protein